MGTFETKEEAIKELVKYNETKYNIDKKQLTFAEIYQEWSDIHFKNIGASSINGYTTAYKHCKKIYNVKFVDLRTVHLQRVIDEDCATYSIRRITKVLFNMLYEYCAKNDIVEKQYSQYIKIGKQEKVQKKEPFTEEEIQMLWDNVDKIENVDLALIQIYTCCRINEILKEIEEINFEGRFMITGSKTESGKSRIVPLSFKIIDLVKKRYNPETKRLVEIDGKPVNYNKYKDDIWNPLMQQLGLSYTTHIARHTRSDNAL